MSSAGINSANVKEEEKSETYSQNMTEAMGAGTNWGWTTTSFVQTYLWDHACRKLKNELSKTHFVETCGLPISTCGQKSKDVHTELIQH
ncbi:phosphoglucan phosphatase DSP4, amyloplastic-like [Prosopis cineraria]|uniref:phosphoglucan phosphatase DSP4, amyloplastic-like n=1 Tax=Prosopis cineraria TaxID=364024 RepID=UPI00240FC866|nr:phosphoglucan phosphatase DSP4, amyloplastic-like [Prosopis cineraria]